MTGRSDRFDGKVALVTGSTQGVGEALARHLVGEGLGGLVVTGRSAERGERLADELSGHTETYFVRADLERSDDLTALVDAADDRFGRIDCLANCAGITDRGDIWDTDAVLFDRMMAVNVRAPFLLVQGVARVARRDARPAAVVNVGSVAGYGGQPFITPYSISKGALMTMTRTLAYQLMRDRIRVVTVNPGWIETPGEDAIQRRHHGATDGWSAHAGEDRPFGRLIQPTELAATLAFVLSDDAGLMTGSIIDYDQTVQGAGDPPEPPPRAGVDAA